MASLDEELIIAEICKYMGWDYHTYMAQPEWFIEIIRLKKNIEAEHSNRESRKLEAQSRRKVI